MGPNLFTGNLVMAWTKDLPHGHILNFQYVTKKLKENNFVHFSIKKMKESGVIDNIWSKYKIKKSEVKTILLSKTVFYFVN